MSNKGVKMSNKKKFSFPVYGYVPVQAQLRGNMIIRANSEEEAKEIARSIAGTNYESLPDSCDLDQTKMEWDDDQSEFAEYIEYEQKRKNNIINIRINDDDVEDLEEVE